MWCFRFAIRRDLVRYADGELPLARIATVEAHLVDCPVCRETVVALRDGRAFARSLPAVAAPADRWNDIEAAIASGREVAPPRAARSRPRFSTPRSPIALAGWAVALVVLLVNAWFVVSPRVWHEAAPDLSVESGPVDLDGFQTVSVRDIQANTKPHVVAEGRVAEVRIDDEDGDLMFKLVDDHGEQDKFIVCEVIDPIRIAPPVVGSKVRVYGVSRFDAQADRNWFEIHPVLSIEQLAR